MKVNYRDGKKEDCYRIAELDDIASDGAIEFLFHDLIPNVSSVQIVASNLENDIYPHTYRSVIVAKCDNNVIGISLSFPARFHKITDEMQKFFPAERLEHFRNFFSTRVEGSYFLDALCVDEKYRNKGVGSKLIELTKIRAQKEGYNVLSLIVFSDNINAQRLYKNRGFETVKNIKLNSHRLMPHKGGCVLMKTDIKII